MKLNNTRNYFTELTISVLQEAGWETKLEEGYIIANKNNDEERLVIYVVSNVIGLKESSTSVAKEKPILKLKRKSELLAGDNTPCISYGIAKKSLTELEVLITPVSAIEEYGYVGGEYSRASNHYHYNYMKVNENELPKGAILRYCWSGKKLKNNK